MRIIQKIIILITIQLKTNSLKTNNEYKEIILFPNHENIITPFEIQAESKLDFENNYHLNAQCSSSVHKKLSFSTLSESLCEKEHDFKYESLNIFLNNLKARLDTKENIIDLNINYEISFFDKDNKKIILNFKQNLFLAKKIPVEEDIKEFFYDQGRDTEFYVEILKIPKKYLLNINQSFLKLVQTNKDFPDFIDYVLVDGKFFFKGEIPKSFDEDFTLSYYIFDEFNKLLSEEKKFNLIKIEKSTSHTMIIIIVIFVILIILGCVITYFYLKKKKLKEEKKRKINLEIKNIKTDGNIMSSDRFGLITDQSSVQNIYNFKDQINLKNKLKFDKDELLKNKKNKSFEDEMDEKEDSDFDINIEKDGKILKNEDINSEEDITGEENNKSFENKKNNKI